MNIDKSITTVFTVASQHQFSMVSISSPKCHHSSSRLKPGAARARAAQQSSQLEQVSSTLRTRDAVTRAASGEAGLKRRWLPTSASYVAHPLN